MLIKIHPDLAVAALNSRQDRLYRIWVVARALDESGCGKIKVSDIQEAIDANDLKGLSPGTLRRLLCKGNSTWWIRYKHQGQWWLELRGLLSVCLSLGVEKLRRTPALFSIRDAKMLQYFRAICYTSLFPSFLLSNPVSRTVLERLTKLTRRTLYTYEKLLKDEIRKQQNSMPASIPWKMGDEVPEGHYVDYLANGKLGLLRRLPTSYSVNFMRTARGMCRTVNRILREDSVRHWGTEKQSKKLFYRNTKAASRRIQKGFDFIALATTKRTRGGAIQWAGMQMIEGKIYAV